MTAMTPGTIVRDPVTGDRGLVLTGHFQVAKPEIPGNIHVAWEGTRGAFEIDPATVEAVGPENPVADLELCSRAGGADACIFAAMGSDGLTCERTTALRWDLIFASMRAKMHPTRIFPACQTEPGREA